MYTCGKCEETKPVEAFAKGRKGEPYRWCRVCRAEYDRARYTNPDGREKARVTAKRISDTQRNRMYVFTYLLAHPCVDCGATNPVTLQFDHQRDKSIDVANMLNHSIARVQREIAKCEVRCGNCHIRKTAKELGHYAWLDEK